MPLALTILLITLCVLAFVAGGYWTVVLIESIRTARALPTAAQARTFPFAKALAASPSTQPLVMIVIPAHNESAVITRVVKSLCQQNYTNFAAVFALDRCTDDTRQKLIDTARRPDGSADPRIGFIEIAECPPDWAGKVNAIHQAVLHTYQAEANGQTPFDYIIFADADTTFHPDCLFATLALRERRQLDMLSLMSTLSASTWFELSVQPVAGFQLLIQYPPRRANRADDRRPIGNGQFMLFTRACYQHIRGHTLVREHLLEDIALARIVHRSSMNPGFLPAAGMLHCEMYRNWPQFQRGWKRIFSELCSRNPGRLRKYATRLLIFSGIVPTGALIAALAGVFVAATTGNPLGWITSAMGLTALAIMFAATAVGASWSKTPLAAAFFHPLGAWLTFRIMFAAAAEIERGEPVQWGGRTYDLTVPLDPVLGIVPARSTQGHAHPGSSSVTPTVRDTTSHDIAR